MNEQVVEALAEAAKVNQAHLEPEDLAEREGVPLSTVYKWNTCGTGPRYMKIGRHVRYRLVDVIAWENEQYVAQDTN